MSKKQKRDTESITFRLQSGSLQKLRQEAEQKDISINTLVTQILKQHSDWYSNASKAGFVAARRTFLVNIMDKISENDITSISEELAKKETKDFVLLLRNEYNLESALKTIESWIRISGFPFRHENTDMIHSYIIQHDMGKKMSLYLAELFRNLFDEFSLKKVQFDLSENIVSLVVDTSSD
jgi:hypothetical protein